MPCFASKDDFPAVYKILWESFDPRADRLFSQSELLEEIEAGNVFVLRKNKEVAAVVTQEIYGKTAILRHIAVNNYLQGHGYGQSILRKYITHSTAMGFRKILLWTNIRNIRAHKLYQLQGFNLDDYMSDVYFI